MFNSLQVTAEEYIVHSLKSSSALIEIKLHGTQCLAPAHWEIICKPQLYVLLLILMDEALESVQSHLPGAIPPPAGVGEPTPMVFST